MLWKPFSQFIGGPGTRRRRFIFLAIVVVFFVFVFLHPTIQRAASPFLLRIKPAIPRNEVDENADHPPSYERLREWERSLPQHDLDLPYPEGRKGRYVKFKVQIQQLGWNNCLNEL